MRNTFGHLYGKVKRAKRKKKKKWWRGGGVRHNSTVGKIEIIMPEGKANFFANLLNNAAYRTTLN